MEPSRVSERLTYMRGWRVSFFGLLSVLLFAAHSAIAVADQPGPLTLSASSVRETCTLGSVTTLDYAIDGGIPPYELTVDGRVVGDASRPNYIPCRPSEIWSPLEIGGGDSVQRISVRVSDSTGARAYAIAEVRLAPPLPAPRYLKVSSGLDGRSAAELTVEWNVPYLPREERTGEAAIRWRTAGDREWTIEHHVGRQATVFSYRSSWRIDAQPSGEQREVQVAQIRHIHDLQAPEALVWSATALVTTAAAPHELQAEATHDAITLSWGPHAPGLAYRASLRAVEPHGYGPRQVLVLDEGPLFEVHFADLMPNTLYRVEVGLHDTQLLEQHRFELRTERAPADWQPTTMLATGIQATYEDREIVVTWTPPEIGSRYETEVCVTESGIEYFTYWQCSHAAAGDDRVSVRRLNNDRWLGGSYDVSVSVQTSPAATAIQRIHIPTYESNLPTRDRPPAAPRFMGVRWFLHPENPAPGTWMFEWEAEDGDLVEVLWRIGDQWFYREYRVSTYDKGQFQISSRASVWLQAIRYRILRDGAWTPWSAPTDTPDLTSPISIISVDQYREHILVRWVPPGRGGDVFSYRLYVTRSEGHEETIDAGPDTHAEVPIRQGDEQYTFRVAALTDDHDEVIASYPRFYERQPFELRMSVLLSECPPSRHGYVRLSWRILGGVPPFTLSIGELLGFETEDRTGSIAVGCRTTADGQLENLVGAVAAADGLTASDVLGHDDVELPWYDDDPFTVKLGPRNVYRDRVLVTWGLCHWHYAAVLRWRPSEMDRWRYVFDLPVDYHGDGWNCSVMWDGLAPLTTYEYQLARYMSAEQLRRPESLRWTDTRTVTTLGPPQDLSIKRDGETVTVSWRRQPDAWAYVVGLRTEGRSWWKRYEPSGEATETMYFYRVPHELELSVELISPPFKNGKPEIPIGIDPDWTPGH